MKIIKYELYEKTLTKFTIPENDNHFWGDGEEMGQPFIESNELKSLPEMPIGKVWKT